MLIFVRIGLVLEGIIFLIMDLRNYVRQRLTETTAILWALVSVILIITGAVPFPEKYTYDTMLWLLMGVCLLLLFLLFEVSRMISTLSMKNQELAMQVSLLTQENEKILRRLGMLMDEEEDTVCR